MNVSLSSVGEWLLRSSWQAAVLALIIFAVQWLAGSRLSARWRYNLWMLVVLRLLLPVVPASEWSVHNLLTLRHKPTQTIPRIMEPVEPKLAVVVLEADPNPLRAAAPPMIPPQPKKSWRDYAIPTAWIVWLAGFSFFFVRTFIATTKLRRQSRQFTPITEPQIVQIRDDARRRMRIRTPIALFAAPNLNTPALMGLIHPRILLPTKVLAEFRASELRLIFLHELAHLRRRDVAVNWLITLLGMLHWFNPLLWLAFARIRAERELACDELVLKTSQPDERREYGNTMIKLLQAFSGGGALPGAVGILEGQAPLRRRITMIAQFERKQSRTWIALLTTLILAMVCLTDAAVGQQRNRPGRGVAAGVGGAGDAGVAAQPNPNGGGGQPWGQGGAIPRFANVEHDKTAEAANEQTRAALRRPMPEVNFQQVALADAIAFIQDVTALNIYVDWKAAEGFNVAKDMPITLKLRNVPAGEVLRLVLREASPEMRYQIESGIVVISPLAPQPVALIKAYNVDDLTRQNDAQLLQSRQLLEDRLKTAPDDSQRDQFRGQIANLEASGEERRHQRMEELVMLIQNTVAPYVNTGMAVRAFDTKLIITADESGHQEVAKVLMMLRDRGEGAGDDKKANPKAAGSPTAP
ncbi:MAG TPA: M56 family metallopeptidase [Tepidisphaeraceae bacterium]|jgi:beta-lactamase regulating signal transducer with metallopeptidase domain|nr:M56 family metallopeptidase [Tepidisphaeraceae bacterium]